MTQKLSQLDLPLVKDLEIDPSKTFGSAVLSSKDVFQKHVAYPRADNRNRLYLKLPNTCANFAGRVGKCCKPLNYSM